MKTYSQKPSEVTRKWYVIDASEAPLGRLATVIASLLIGKGKPSVTSHVDGGDYVVVINSDSLQVTGKKTTDKLYQHHTPYPGGLKTATLSEKMNKDSTDVVFQAVRGMLPVNKLRPGRLDRLKIYPSSEHNHTAQQPETLNLKGTK